MSWHSEIEDKSYLTRMFKYNSELEASAVLEILQKFDWCHNRCHDILCDILFCRICFFPEIFQEVCWAALLCFSVIRLHAHVAVRLILVKPKLVVDKTKFLGLIKWTLAIFMEAQNWSFRTASIKGIEPLLCCCASGMYWRFSRLYFV